MKNTFKLSEKTKNRSWRKILALALAVLLAVNVLFTALPMGNFEKIAADSVSYKDIIHMEATEASVLSVQLAAATEPVVAASADSSAIPDLRFFINGKEIYAGDTVYTPTFAYSEGVLTCTINCTDSDSIKIFAKDGLAITALTFPSDGEKNDALRSVSVNNMPALESMTASGLPSLDTVIIPAAPALKTLDVSGCSLNSLSGIDKTTLQALESFDCTDNFLTYSTLPLPTTMTGTYNYQAQKNVAAPTFVGVGQSVNISSCNAELKLTEGQMTTTAYTWYDAESDTEVTDGVTMVNTGVYSFDETLAGKTLFCSATHDGFSGMTLTTTPITVIDDLAFACTPACEAMALTFTTTDGNAKVFADDEDITASVTVTPNTEGTEYTYVVNTTDEAQLYVTSAAPVTDIAFVSDALDNVQLGACTALETLSITAATDGAVLPLDSIDLRANTALTDVVINDTSLTEINLSLNSALKNADLQNNRLYDFALPVVNTLETLLVNDNNLTSLNLSSCTGLTALDASGNSFVSADLTANTLLTDIDLSDCGLSEVKLAEGVLADVDLSGNKLHHGTLPTAPLTQTPPCASYVYDSQEKVSINDTYSFGDTIDLTQYASSAADDTTTYKMYANGSLKAENTTGTFGVAHDITDQDIYFEITSEKLNGLTVTTETAGILPNLNSDAADRAAVAFNKAGPCEFTVTADRPVYIFWGEGDLEKFEPNDGDYTNPIEISGNVVADSEDENAFLVQIYSSGNIIELDLSHDADSTANIVTGINISHCPDLEVLDISAEEKTAEGERVSLLDVSNNTKLTELYVPNNEITALDLSRNTALKVLDFSNNLVSKTDLTANTALEEVHCGGNSMTELKLTVPGALKKVDCGDNALTFNALPDMDGGEFTYGPQADIAIPTTLMAGTSIDLSAIGAENYTWKNSKTGDTITPKTASNGVFTFGDEHDGISAYCEMTSASYPGLVIKTTPVNLTAKLTEFNNPTAVLYTTLTKGQDVSLTLSCDDTVYIDWGDGKIVSDKTGEVILHTTEDTLEGTAIKLYTAGKLTLISATDMKINKVSLASATDLETLNLSGNDLETIDLSKNTKIKELDISDNNFALKDLPILTIAEDKYTYSPQAAYELPTIKAVGGTVDLSDLKSKSGTNSNFVWYKKGTTEDTALSPSTDYENLGNGKFKFKDTLLNETVYAVAVNTDFPDFTTANKGMRTTEMKITPGGEFTLNDGTALIYDVVIDEGTTCNSSDGTVIAAGDLTRAKAPSNNTLLTFNARKFTDTSSVTTASLLSKVKAKLSSFDSTKNNYYIFDFSFLDNKNQPVVGFSGKAKITLKYPNTTVAEKYKNYTFYLFHYNESGIKAGTMDEIAVSAAADGLTFESDSFSPYVLVYMDKSGSNNNGGSGGSDGSGSGSGNGTGGSGNSAPGTGETDNTPETGDSNTGAIIALIALIICGAVIIGVGVSAVIRKRRSK